MKRTHVITITFENGNKALLTVQDRADGSTLHIEGLNHITKSSLESFVIPEFVGDKRRNHSVRV